MNENADNNQIILRYINGELSPEELSSFEHRMANDKEFAEEVEFAKNYHEAQELKKLKEALTQFHQKKKDEGFIDKIHEEVKAEIATEQKAKGKKLGRRWLFPAVAAAAILIGIVSVLIIPPRISGPSIAETIVKTEEKIPEDLPASRAGHSFNDPTKKPVEILENALLAYNKKEYATAAVFFEEYLSNIPSDAPDPGIEFYTAKCYLLMNPPKLEKGLAILEKLEASRELKPKVVLHRAAAYILNKAPEKALKLIAENEAAMPEQSERFAKLKKEAIESQKQ